MGSFGGERGSGVRIGLCSFDLWGRLPEFLGWLNQNLKEKVGGSLTEPREIKIEERMGMYMYG